MHTRQEKFIENSLAAYWRYAQENLGPWAEYVAEWVTETQTKLKEATPSLGLQSPLISEVGVNSYVILRPKEGAMDFRPRIYLQALIELAEQKIFLDTKAADKVDTKSYYQLRYKIGCNIADYQKQLSEILEEQIKVQPDFKTYGDQSDSYLSLWLKNGVILPKPLNQLPTIEEALHAKKLCNFSIDQLGDYQSRLPESADTEDFFENYRTSLGAAAYNLDQVISMVEGPLQTMEKPTELDSMIKRDLAKLDPKLPENKPDIYR